MSVSQDLMGFFERLYGAVRQTILVPQADPRQTLIVGGILVLLTAIVVLIGLSLYSVLAGKKRVVRRRKARPLTPRERWMVWSITAGIFFILLIGGYAYAERPSFCASCHIEQNAFQTWKKSSHRNVGCLGCHRSPGASGYVTQKIDYVRWMWNFGFENYQMPLKGPVDNATCRKCHVDDISKVVTWQGINVRHKDFLEKGSRCTDCHNTVGHEVPVARYPSMDECLTCHNTKTARADCKVCHTPETPGSQRIRREALPITIPPPSQCRSCHTPSTWQKCIQCHGLEMPHPAGWREGHSRLAFLDKDLCLKCHTSPPKNKSPGTHGGNVSDGTFCNICHSFPSPHGTTERWVSAHGPIALGNVVPVESACVRCHPGTSPVRYCVQCHSEQICDRCHEPGKYAPPGLP